MSGTPVFYARSADYERKNLRTALERLVEGQLRETGGVAGKKLLLKPNLLAWRHSNDIACVHPAVIVETTCCMSSLRSIRIRWSVSFSLSERHFSKTHCKRRQQNASSE